MRGLFFGVVGVVQYPSMTTTLLRGGRIIDPSQNIDQTGDVLVCDGKIVQVSDTPINDACEDVIECAGCIVSPGLIDVHVHFREPSEGKHEETIATGSASAAAGGFTTVCTMPNTTPAIDTPERINQSITESQRVGLCRVLPTGCATAGRKGKTLAPIPAMADAGAIGFTDDGCVVEDDAMMAAVLISAKSADRFFMQHCQDPKTTIGSVMHEGAMQEELGYGAWPRIAEESIIARDIAINESTGARWHAQHLSSGGSVELIRKARKNGQPVSGEASPHHLLLTDVACKDLGTKAKMNPPLREQSDIDTIKEGISDSTITILATDHAPHPQRTKSVPFPEASFGIVGLDCALGLYAKALIDDGVLDWPAMLAMMTTNPANLIGRTDLGTLTVGGTADITVIDPATHWTIDMTEFASTGRNCPFHDWNVNAQSIATMLTGRLTHHTLGDRANHCNLPEVV